MLKFKLYLNLILSFLLIAGSIPAQALSPTTSALVQKNYLANGGFENGPVGFKTYKNAAQATPVTGLGGTPATTMTTTTLTPIADKTSALFTHTASNLQGEGVALPFALEPRAKAKLLTISGDYQIVSGTYSGGTGIPTITDSDVEVYVYDVDAGQIIQPAAYRLDGGVIGQMYSISATFQSSASSTNYRLIFHNATTTTNAFALKIDNLSVSKVNAAPGTVVTDPVAFTPTGTWTTNTTYSGTWWREGKYLIANVKVLLSGAPNNVLLAVNIPSGFSIDTAFLQSSAQFGENLGPLGGLFPASVGAGYVQYYSTTQVAPTILNSTTTGSITSLSGTIPGAWAAGQYLTLNYRIPIVGWSSSSTAAADSGEGRVVSGSYGLTSSYAAASGNQIKYDTVVSDTNGMYSPSTGLVTIPVSGYYRISATADATSATSVYVGKNGSIGLGYLATMTSANTVVSGGLTVSLKSGDTIGIYANTAATFNNTTGTVTGFTNTFSIERLSANSQILAGESVNARYTSTSGTSIGTAATLVPFQTKDFDSHSAFTGTQYNVPVSGKISVTALLTTVATATSAGQHLNVFLYKNGSQYTALGSQTYQTINSGYSVGGSDEIPCNAGDYLQIYATSDTATSLYTGAGFSHVSFKRIGN